MIIAHQSPTRPHGNSQVVRSRLLAITNYELDGRVAVVPRRGRIRLRSLDLSGQLMGRQRLVPSAPVFACAKVRPDQSDSIGGPCEALISAKGGYVGPEVRRLRGPGHCHVGLESTLVRRRADSPAGGSG
jgi:hypothetical protein